MAILDSIFESADPSNIQKLASKTSVVRAALNNILTNFHQSTGFTRIPQSTVCHVKDGSHDIMEGVEVTFLLDSNWQVTSKITRSVHDDGRTLAVKLTMAGKVRSEHATKVDATIDLLTDLGRSGETILSLDLGAIVDFKGNSEFHGFHTVNEDELILWAANVLDGTAVLLGGVPEEIQTSFLQHAAGLSGSYVTLADAMVAEKANDDSWLHQNAVSMARRGVLAAIWPVAKLTSGMLV